MSLSLLAWVAAAILLFWSVGAYNRLVRLRSEVLGAFAVLEPVLARQIELALGILPEAVDPSGVQRPGDLFDEVAALWAGLGGAAAQFSAALAAMKPRPLDSQAAAALTAASDVFSMAWQRVHHEAHDLAGAPLPEPLWLQWQQLGIQADAARQGFADAVTRYNDGIAQFPASVLAWLFGFKPARAA